MQILQGTFDGALRVTEALALHGTARRTVTIATGARFVLRGICGGDVILEEGGNAEVWGIIKGSVRNRGGGISIFGLVEGDVETTSGGTWIAPTSVVRGTVRPEAEPR